LATKARVRISVKKIVTVDCDSKTVIITPNTVLTMNTQTFTADQLSQLTDLPKRTIRYYIQLGLVDRPIGETKAAHYVDAHLTQLLRVKRLTEARMPLERIRQVLDSEADAPPTSTRKPGSIEVKTHLYVMPGVEVQISPQEAGLSPEQIRSLVQEVMASVEKVMKKSQG
jgi:DNA-binding transcriptional MerR regulator